LKGVLKINSDNQNSAWQIEGVRSRLDATSVPVQDDSREQQMVALFNLTVPPDRGRSDIDAYLKLAELEELRRNRIGKDHGRLRCDASQTRPPKQASLPSDPGICLSKLDKNQDMAAASDTPTA
jgi:hypothetical protein